MSADHWLISPAQIRCSSVHLTLRIMGSLGTPEKQAGKIRWIISNSALHCPIVLKFKYYAQMQQNKTYKNTKNTKIHGYKKHSLLNFGCLTFNSKILGPRLASVIWNNDKYTHTLKLILNVSYSRTLAIRYAAAVLNVIANMVLLSVDEFAVYSRCRRRLSLK